MRRSQARDLRDSGWTEHRALRGATRRGPDAAQRTDRVPQPRGLGRASVHRAQENQLMIMLRFRVPVDPREERVMRAALSEPPSLDDWRELILDMIRER